MSSCVDSQIDYSYQFREQGYFVTGLMNDQEVQVIVQEVLNPLNITEVKSPSGVVVFLTDTTGLKVQLGAKTPGYFRTNANFKPDASTSYSLTITIPHGDTLFGRPQKVVNPVNISRFHFEKSDQNEKAKLFTEFADPLEGQNYYSYRIIHYWRGESIHEPQKLLSLSPMNDKEFSGLTKTLIDDAILTTFIGGGWQPIILPKIRTTG